MSMNFSMKDSRWAMQAFPFTLGEYGCLIVSLSCLISKTPDNVLKILLAKKCFKNNGDLENLKAAFALGLKRYTWLPPETKITAPIICETNYHAKSGFPKHFFVALPNGKIIDPLDGLTKDNLYKNNMVSQRLFC